MDFQSLLASVAFLPIGTLAGLEAGIDRSTKSNFKVKEQAGCTNRSRRVI